LKERDGVAFEGESARSQALGEQDAGAPDGVPSAFESRYAVPSASTNG